MAVKGSLTCLDQNGSPLPGVQHIVTQIGVAEGSTGNSFSKVPRSFQSNTDGLVEATGLTPGATYWIQRGSAGSPVRFTAQDVDFDLPDCLG